jgi:hypothetical protein
MSPMRPHVGPHRKVPRRMAPYSTAAGDASSRRLQFFLFVSPEDRDHHGTLCSVPRLATRAIQVEGRLSELNANGLKSRKSMLSSATLDVMPYRCGY